MTRSSTPAVRACGAAVAASCAALGLAACSTPAPIRYHTLLAPAAQADGAQAQPTAPFAVDVLPVAIPAQLDQLQLVVRQADGSLALPDTERWAAPLDDEIRAALSAELARQLGTQDIAGLARPAGQPVVRVKLQVRRLDAWLGRRVQLDAGWSLSVVDDAGRVQTRMTCQGRFDEAAASATGGYADLVRTQQRALGALAARIAADARHAIAANAARADCTPPGQ